MTVSADARALDVLSDPRKQAIVRDEPDGRVALFTSIIAPGASPELTALVWHYARALDLDPLRKMVMLISMDRKNDRGGYDKEYGVIVGVHGVIALLGRQPDYAGLLSGVVFPGEKCSIAADGTVQHEYDVAERATKQAGAVTLPIGAYATVRRVMHGQVVQFTTYTPFGEVAQTTWKKNPQTGRSEKVLRYIWAARPSWMNEKCAIMFSARKAYDHILGRVYGAEEFGAVSTEQGISIPEGFGDRVEVVSADPENQESPSVMAGLIPGSETPDPSRGEESQEAIVGDPAPEATDSLVEHLKPPPSIEEAERELKGALHFGALTFLRKPREFIKHDTDGSRYVVDSELLAGLGLPIDTPLLLTGASAEMLMRVAACINGICHGRSNRRGR